MAVSITIDNLPEETLAELTAQAALQGCSLQTYLREKLIELAPVRDMQTLLAKIRQDKAASGVTLTPEQILEYRDADRR